MPFVLEPESYVDDVTLDGDDLTGQDGTDARLDGCRWRGVRLDEVVLRRARLSDTALDTVSATTLDVTSGDWLDVVVRDSRLGGMPAFDADWRRVRVTGGKIDYLNLRDARLTDVTFDGVTIGELDLTGARATKLVLRDVTVRELVVDRATLSGADLTGLATGALRVLRGVSGLRGARITGSQSLDLLPALTDHVGLVVDE
ncbi:pentapeptide repeat-containing protein [Luteimicrobium xylanilyticum]|uniref:Pentapeptide repeat-containing protein n=1 Tax=Luteimicrobium xylanilyticum TaxID=1133546 RepID=A0A5P9QEY6_9MICO|nr:pentapeptide repeat-containing protein [Luteimicrobium xylanilyticum]QFU99672.1 hypothetical protein KDY119_03207 [Luteimicrobium xylanilyticum]